MQWTTLGTAVAKNMFQLHGVDEHGKVVMQKRVSRGKVRATWCAASSPLVRPARNGRRA